MTGVGARKKYPTMNEVCEAGIIPLWNNYRASLQSTFINILILGDNKNNMETGSFPLRGCGKQSRDINFGGKKAFMSYKRPAWQSQPALHGVAGTTRHWRPLKRMVARVWSILRDPEMKCREADSRGWEDGGRGACPCVRYSCVLLTQPTTRGCCQNLPWLEGERATFGGGGHRTRKKNSVSSRPVCRTRWYTSSRQQAVRSPGSWWPQVQAQAREDMEFINVKGLYLGIKVSDQLGSSPTTPLTGSLKKGKKKKKACFYFPICLK